jgi:xanthine dehydrogenase YagS FAD-binding subunit
MKPVTLYKPASVQEAMQILAHHGTEAAVYAGGTDLLVRLKNRLNAAPKYLVDIKQIGELNGIRETPDGGLAIGPTTTITEVQDSELVAKKYPLLVETLKRISSPELRNQSTIAGDILQEVWCQYLRGNYPCWRNGGYICYGAIGDNSYYHSVMGGRLCFAVYHGDAAIGLEALDAGVKIAGPSGTRELTLEELIPGDVLIDGRVQSHVLRSDEILTEIRLPAPKPGWFGTFQKIRPRGVWDFAMASAAVNLQFDGGKPGGMIKDARVIFGGIAVAPYREHGVEAWLKGKSLAGDLAQQAATRALLNAAPLKYNEHKVEVARGALASGLAALAG